MKIPPLTRIAIILAILLTASPPTLFAGVEKNEDGTYTISGTWSYWQDKGLIAPAGKTRDFGEFNQILFKPLANEFEGAKSLKKTVATFKVKAREGGSDDGKILIVEQILERLDGGGPGEAAPKEE